MDNVRPIRPMIDMSGCVQQDGTPLGEMLPWQGTCPSPEIQNHLYDAIAKLPRDVQLFALHRCIFFSVGAGRLGQAIMQQCTEAVFSVHRGCIEAEMAAQGTKRYPNIWTIILTEGVTPEAEAFANIAHTIAVAWVDERWSRERAEWEKTAKPGESRRVPNFEVQAAELVREWGFKGKGANPDAWR